MKLVIITIVMVCLSLFASGGPTCSSSWAETTYRQQSRPPIVNQPATGQSAPAQIAPPSQPVSPGLIRGTLAACKDSVRELAFVAGKLETANCGLTGQHLSRQFDQVYEKVMACNFNDTATIMNIRSSVAKLGHYAARCECDAFINTCSDAATAIQGVINRKCWEAADEKTFLNKKQACGDAQSRWNVRCSASASPAQKAKWDSLYKNTGVLFPAAQQKCSEANTCRNVLTSFVQQVAFIKEHNTPRCNQGNYPIYRDEALKKRDLYHKVCSNLWMESQATFISASMDLDKVMAFCMSEEQVMSYRCPLLGEVTRTWKGGPTTKKFHFLWHGCQTKQDVPLCLAYGVPHWQVSKSFLSITKKFDIVICCEQPPACHQQFHDFVDKMKELFE